MKTKILRSILISVGMLFAVARVALALPNYDHAPAQTSVRNPRLAPSRLVRPAPKQADIEATLNLSASDPTKTLPLWTFSVNSTRDGNTKSPTT